MLKSNVLMAPDIGTTAPAGGDFNPANTNTFLNMINPEILTDMISGELPKAIRFTALAPVDTSLEGRPGAVITVPRWKYIGDAKDFSEGEAINYAKLANDTDTFTIKKMGIGVKFTDESMLSGYGDPVGEGKKQIVTSMASKFDNDILATAMQCRLTLTTDVTKMDMIDAIEAAFNDDTDERNTEDSAPVTGVLFMNPKDVNKLRKAATLDWTRATDLGDTILVSGTFGELLGWQIVRTRKINEGSALAIKPNAMKTYMKRNVMSEVGRDMDHKVTKFNADEHYGVAIYDDTKLMAINPDKFKPEGTVIERNVKKTPRKGNGGAEVDDVDDGGTTHTGK